VVVTDGFTDQIGGSSTNPTSFGYRRIEQTLTSMASRPADHIAQRLKEEFDVWRGEQKHRDDFTVIAFTL
jgi:serine phosphatase RsbU (regulator of sigma subunit)